MHETTSPPRYQAYSTLLTSATADEVIRSLLEVNGPLEFEDGTIYPRLQLGQTVRKEVEIKVDGTYIGKEKLNTALHDMLNLTVLPVGQSTNVEVRALWREQLALNYFYSKILTKLAVKWPDLHFIQEQAEGTFAKINIKADIASLEQALSEFAKLYQNDNVRHVTLGNHYGWSSPSQLTDRFGKPIDPDQRRCWSIVLSLPTTPHVVSVSQIVLEAEAIKQLGDWPLLLTITKAGCRYPEITAFIDVLLRHLGRLWETQDILHPVDLSRDHTTFDGNLSEKHPSLSNKDPDIGDLSRPIISAVGSSDADPATENLSGQGDAEDGKTIAEKLDILPLSGRDRIMIEMNNQGYSSKGIAKHLNVSDKTVRNVLAQLRYQYPGLILTHRELLKRGLKPRLDEEG